VYFSVVGQLLVRNFVSSDNAEKMAVQWRATRSRQKRIGGRERDDAHAHYVIAKHFQFHIYRPTSSHPRVVWFFTELAIVKGSSDTETDSGTDTEDVESFMPNFVSLFCR
jgi:hypothetical protein